MSPEQLKKILNIIKKTGDRVIIFDGNAPDDSYVIMNLDNYVENFTEDQRLTINPVEQDKPDKPINSDNLSKIDNLTEEDLTDKINREISMWKNRDISPSLAEENKPKKVWQIPPQVKDKAQEIN